MSTDEQNETIHTCKYTNNVLTPLGSRETGSTISLLNNPTYKTDRKENILKYKTVNITNKRMYARAIRGYHANRNTIGVQSVKLTNPNVKGLRRIINRLICARLTN
jgi:hypothetical protein